jgi:hypothetical protein
MGLGMAASHDSAIVECYAGYRGEETPRALRWGDRRVGVAEVRERWLTPDHRWFRLLLENGQERTVRQDVTSLRWEIVPSGVSAAAPTRGGGAP